MKKTITILFALVAVAAVAALSTWGVECIANKKLVQYEEEIRSAAESVTDVQIAGLPGTFSGMRIQSAKGSIVLGFSSELSGPIMALLPADAGHSGEEGVPRAVVLELTGTGAAIHVRSEAESILLESDPAAVRLELSRKGAASAGIGLEPDVAFLELEAGRSSADVVRLEASSNELGLHLGAGIGSEVSRWLSILMPGVVRYSTNGKTQEKAIVAPE